MTPAARVQAAIDILDIVIGAAENSGPPADRILSEWFRGHRFAGSKDKRALREHVYAAIRSCGPVPASGRAAMLRVSEAGEDLSALFDGSNYGPAAIEPGEKPALGGLAPAWLEERLAQSDVSGESALALLDRAPLDLRVNSLKASRASVELPVEFEDLASANGVRVPAGSPVEQWEAFEQGLVEVQDAGSQLACEAVGAQAGETVIDLCAGAGGKTLALAAAMGNQGTLIAADTDRGRLSRLAPRANRAGATIAQTILLNPGIELEALSDWRGKADRVLIDAPCSGTGTWRRNPEARWRLNDGELTRLVSLQARLMRLAAELLRPGGTMTYITCSLLDAEGAGQIDSFMADHANWRSVTPDLPLGTRRGGGIRLTPSHDETDGFFIACLEKP